ncbi:hypothetical protein LY90DRAFT_706077, partial [Neocallimastix californiae]
MELIKPRHSNYIPLVKENTTKTILVKNKVMRTRNSRLTTAIISSMLDENESENLIYKLIIREQPENVKCIGPTEKDRKPIEPSPIIQLCVFNENHEPYIQCLYNSNFFIIASLLEENKSLNARGQYDYNVITMDKYKAKKMLLGTTVASMHQLKDLDGTMGSFFIFYDLSVHKEGTFRLKYSLYEMKQGKTIYRTCTISEPFTVFSYKNFPGYKESSSLAKYFAEQGVKIKLKKDVNVPRIRYSKYSNDIWLNDGGKILSREEMIFKEKLSQVVKQEEKMKITINKKVKDTKNS